MTSMFRMVPVGLVALAMLSGCSMFSRDEYGLRAGEWEDDDGWDDWDEDRPIGARQKHVHGKLWPPYPRPTEEQAEYSHRFHHAHYWPLPYVCYDRAYVQQVLSMQVVNGWTAETTLYHYHFDEETNLLNQSGQLHLGWILCDVPPSRRFVWVQTCLDPTLSQIRLANVQAAAVEMVGEAHLPSIMLRPGSVVGGRPAQEVDLQNRAYLNSMPVPRLPNRGAATP
jgi:hypothetical protein